MPGCVLVHPLNKFHSIHESKYIYAYGVRTTEYLCCWLGAALQCEQILIEYILRFQRYRSLTLFTDLRQKRNLS